MLSVTDLKICFALYTLLSLVLIWRGIKAAKANYDAYLTAVRDEVNYLCEKVENP